MKTKVEGLSVKAGPTESGVGPSPSPTPSPTPNPTPVGGQIVPIDKFSVFLSQYGLLLLILLIPLAFVLYKKRSMVLRLFAHVQMTLWRIAR